MAILADLRGLGLVNEHGAGIVGQSSGNRKASCSRDHERGPGLDFEVGHGGGVGRLGAGKGKIASRNHP